MPIILPKDLPASDILLKENVFVISKKTAQKQDIRPLKIAVVNLMPTKIETEIQLLRLLSNTPLQAEIDLIKTSHESKNTDKEHLLKFYKTVSEMKNNKYDAMIITGAPVERLDYSNVDYWEELKDILNFARENVYSVMFLCWAAGAALYHYYGVPKHLYQEKLFGVFEYEADTSNVLMKGFDKSFFAPQSRFCYCEEEDIKKIGDLQIVAKGVEGGIHLISSFDNRLIFVFGHSEYDDYTLDREYKRDLAKGAQINVPKNYYLNDDPKKDVRANWKACGNLLFYNWLNYCVYQETPYDISLVSKNPPQNPPQKNKNPDKTPAEPQKENGSCGGAEQYEHIINVAILGCGVVGSGTYLILKEKLNQLTKKLYARCGKRIKIEVAKVFDKNYYKLKIIDQHKIAKSLDEIFDDPNIDIVVEVLGGLQAGEIILKAMEKGKSVVSANKLAIASYGGRLEKRAKECGVDFMFEASVAGTIPVVRTINDCLVANSINKISGILNGTTNFMLTEMSEKGLGFEEALLEAQKAGYAEANPSADIDGDDVAYKLTILARLAFGDETDMEKIEKTGIKGITPQIIGDAKRRGKTIKLIGHAEKINNAVSLSVKPVEIDSVHPIAQVNGTLNAVLISCDNAGDVLLQGAGAGCRPTASAIVSDVFAIAERIAGRRNWIKK